VAINQVIHAEVAVGLESLDRLERALSGVGMRRLSLPWGASLLTARVRSGSTWRAVAVGASCFRTSSSVRTPRPAA